MKKTLSLLTVIILSFILINSPVNASNANEFWAKQIVISNRDTLILKNNGDVIAWGENDYLDGSNKKITKPKKIAGSVEFLSQNINDGVYAIKKNGISSGEWGIGNLKDSKLKYISKWYSTYVVIKDNGELWGWSHPGYYGMNEKPKKLMDDVNQAIVDDMNLMMLKENGELWFWSDSSDTPQKLMNDVKYINTRNDNYYRSYYAIKGNGELWGWGDNIYNQVDPNSSFDDISTPTMIMSNVNDVSSGNGYVMVIKSNGELWGWGSNSDGQIGIDSTEDVRSPKLIMDKVKLVSAGSSKTVAIREDGTVWAWGDNLGGYFIPDKKEEKILTPVKIMDAPATLSVEKAREYKNASQWAKPELREAEKKGLLLPVTNLDFSKPITREKFSEITVKYYESLTGEKISDAIKNPFIDTKNNKIVNAYNLGIVKGTSENIFSPQKTITREEMCVMLYRAFIIARPSAEIDYKYKRFEDESEFSSWAKDSIKKLRSLEIIQGDSNNNFNPKKNTSVEEAVIMAYRLLQRTD